MPTKRSGGTRSALIHCPNCGEDYSVTYKRCPFCDEKAASQRRSGEGEAGDAYEEDLPQGGKRLASPGGGGGFGRWPVSKIVRTVLSLAVILAAVWIVATQIVPLVSRSQVGTPGTSAPPASTQPVDTPPVTDSPAPETTAPVDETETPQPSETIPAGQTVAFVGPSGGGKTTLANLVSRFFDPQEGAVRIGGVDVRDISKEELMNTVSFVFQNSRLLKASILENVRMGKPDATREEVLRALHSAQCDDILEKFPQGADTVIGTKGVYLSGGEQQRIAIARAMLKNAPILILDEATAFADPDNETKVQAAFTELSRGKTVLLIAHRLTTVTHADRICVVQDGRIVESGTSRELLEKGGLFRRMWDNYQTSVQWKVAKEA